MKRIAIVGGGIAGLAAAYELAQLAHGGVAVEATVFEASNRFGGLIETVREGGFTVEGGPDGWVSAKPWARELALELGLGDELIPSNDATRKTWVLLSTPENPVGRLVAMPARFNMMVPTDPGALDGSALFSEGAIAAYRAEPTRADELRAAAPQHDESVADFTLRHFGAEVLERVAAPLLGGVFGGDVRKLSVRAVMPAFVAMEREHGSLIAALQAGSQTSQRNERPFGGTMNPPTVNGIFTTLRSGLGTLVDRLVSALPAHRLRPHTTVTAILANATGPRWQITTTTHAKQTSSESFDAVLLATPLDATRRLLAPLDAAAAELLPVESSSAVLVAFCYADASRTPVPPGFGFLVPPKFAAPEEEVDSSANLLLACTFVDQKFPHRVPPGGREVRAFFGGAAADRITRCNNDEIAAIARLELARVLHSVGPPHIATAPAPVPVLTVVRRWPNSLPQYAVGHLDRVAELEARLQNLSGLIVLGNSLHGVGIPDLIRDARQASRTTATDNGQRTTDN